MEQIPTEPAGAKATERGRPQTVQNLAPCCKGDEHAWQTMFIGPPHRRVDITRGLAKPSGTQEESSQHSGACDNPSSYRSGDWGAGLIRMARPAATLLYLRSG